MSNSKISALTGATTPLAGTEVLPIVQSGTTKQVSVANLTAGRTQTSNGIVQGTSATGYNFTANTPTSGMTSQLLNWYEEGNWTPIDGSGASLSLTIVSATYTRIGRLVVVQAEVTYPTTTSTLGAAVTGLPFLAAVYGTSSFYAPTVAGVILQSTTTLYFGNNSGAAIQNLMLSARNLYLTATYRT
jgi:hypothetical protein